jgi:hypothetical protein
MLEVISVVIFSKNYVVQLVEKVNSLWRIYSKNLVWGGVEPQTTTQKSISIVFSVSSIRHDSSLSKYRKQKQHPLKILKLVHIQGVTASVYGTCWVTNHDEWRLRKKTIEMDFCVFTAYYTEVHLHFFCVSSIRHDSSLNKYRKQKQSPPGNTKTGACPGGWLLLFTVLAEWRIMANRAYAKTNEDGILCSILC